jgi:Domain of unknown function (DUF397)
MGGRSADEVSWHVSKQCDGGQCVEIGILGKSVLVRNSADRGGTYVTLGRDKWQVFVAGIKDGDFDSL